MKTRFNKSETLIIVALEDECPRDLLSGWRVVYTGVGKVNALIGLSKAISEDKPKTVINFGTAGSKDIPIHTLVKCTKFIQRDMNTVGLGFPRGITPFEQSSAHAMDFSHIANPIDKNYVCRYSS